MDINIEKYAIKINDNFVLIEDNDLRQLGDVDFVDTSKYVEIDGSRYVLKKSKYRVDDYKIWDIVESRRLKQYPIDKYDKTINWLDEMVNIRKKRDLSKSNLRGIPNDDLENVLFSVVILPLTILFIIIIAFIIAKILTVLLISCYFSINIL